jgi:type II secretory ATPase GspE/PulE/Tfp pilus assembly ATPase PilB-like protein
VKFLARLRTYQESFPQDGRISAGDTGIGREVRVATYPTVSGEKLVMRLYGSGPVLTLGEIGLDEEAATVLHRSISSPSGMILLTGPSGSGKTTTIYACLREIHSRFRRHIITIEDPAERILEDVMQTEVNEARGLGFAEAARHLLRQDPEVLVIGEIRDEETAAIAVRAALTGHLLIATLHAGSCSAVHRRLVELSQDDFGALSALSLIWNQRLVRRLCGECRGRGCPHCLQTGYRGRIPVAEYAQLTDSVHDDLRSGNIREIRPDRSLMDSAEKLVNAGLTTREEMTRVLGNPS